MKILVVCQHYYPENFRITDICEELVRRGHNVFVITGLPNYPEGKIYDGYTKGKRRDETINGVRVHRCYTIGRKGGVVKRVLNYYSFAISSTKYAKKLKEEFDLVFVYQLSPVMMANAGVAYAKKHGKRLVIYTLDLWPASLSAGGIHKGNPVYWHYKKVSKRIYTKAYKLLVSSSSFINYFEREFNISPHTIEYLPQYCEDCFSVRECEKKPDGYIDLMFAGNVGKIQSVETIIKTAIECRDITNLRWHIVGSGTSLGSMKKLAKKSGLDNIFFYGRKSIDEMPKLYAKADAMLVTMIKDDCLSLTLTGKVQSYLMAGKPIIGAIDGETMDIINQVGCGYCVGAEDYKALAEVIKKFCIDVKNGTYKKCCENSHKFYEETFRKELFMNKFEGIIDESVND